MNNVILDFCGTCGNLLEEGLGKQYDPRCRVCNASVETRHSRLQGTFSVEDAARFRVIEI